MQKPPTCKAQAHVRKAGLSRYADPVLVNMGVFTSKSDDSPLDEYGVSVSPSGGFSIELELSSAGLPETRHAPGAPTSPGLESTGEGGSTSGGQYPQKKALTWDFRPKVGRPSKYGVDSVFRFLQLLFFSTTDRFCGKFS